MNERRVDEYALLGAVQQVAHVPQVSVAAANAVPSAVLVDHKQLTVAQPALSTQYSSITNS